MSNDTETNGDFLIEGIDAAFSVTHEPCGQSVLLTLRAHLDTLDRIAVEHVCP